MPTTRDAAASVFQSTTAHNDDVIIAVSVVVGFLCLAVVVGAGLYCRLVQSLSGESSFFTSGDQAGDALHRQPPRTKDPDLVDWPEDLFVVITRAEKKRISEQIERNLKEKNRRARHKRRRLDAEAVDWPDELFD